MPRLREIPLLRASGRLAAALAALALLLPELAHAGPRTGIERRARDALLRDVLSGLPAPPSEATPAPARGADDEGEWVEEEEEEEGDEALIEFDDDEPPARRGGKAGGKASGGGKAAAPAKGASGKAAVAPTPAKAAPRPKGAAECDFRTPLYEHEVAAGDNLGRIAGRYGVRKDDLVRLNPALKKNPNLVRPGQKLKVCPELAPRDRQASEHEVQKGENLTKIAARYGTTPSELIALQPKKLADRLRQSPKSLQPGQKLVVMVEVAVRAELAPVEEERGTLVVSEQLPERPHYHIKRPHLAFGTPHTVKAIQAAVSRYKQRKPKGPKVHIGDISRQGGGPLRGHKSHQRGVDVDVGLVHRGMLAAETKFVDANSNTLDVARTWALVKAFADTPDVRAIFLDYGVQKALYEHARKQGVSEQTLDELFQYPRGKGHPHGLIRHWKGHRDHFHVRFRR